MTTAWLMYTIWCAVIAALGFFVAWLGFRQKAKEEEARRGRKRHTRACIPRRRILRTRIAQ